jgi:hypothetical protein
MNRRAFLLGSVAATVVLPIAAKLSLPQAKTFTVSWYQKLPSQEWTRQFRIIGEDLANSLVTNELEAWEEIIGAAPAILPQLEEGEKI